MRNDGLAYHSFSDIDWDSPSGLSRFSSPTSLACEDISVTSLSFSLASSRLSAGFLTFVVGRVVTGICVRRRLRMQKMHRLSIQLTQTSHILTVGRNSSFYNRPLKTVIRIEMGWLSRFGNTYKGAMMATTNTGIKKLNAVGVMPELPTVFCHSRAWRKCTSCSPETAGMASCGLLGLGIGSERKRCRWRGTLRGTQGDGTDASG